MKEKFYQCGTENDFFDPDEDADCYMGVYYKIAFMSPQRVDILVWSGHCRQWEDLSIQMHPKFTADQRKRHLHEFLAQTAAAFAYCGKAVRNLPNAAH
jgi:hypothetical protein